MVDQLKVSVIAACRIALLPLVRMLLKHGVMHREFAELAKEAYVESARREYGIRGRPTNISRVALMTGLDRKEVSRISKALEDQAGDRQTTNNKQDRIARLLSGWFQDPDYQRDDGTPMMLPINGPPPSYADLVKRYAGDVPGITILRELERTGAVRMHNHTAVEVLRRNYRLDAVDPESIARAGSVLADLGRTVTHNLYRTEGEDSRFEARASNFNIPRDALPEYREFVYAECQTFLERVDHWLSAHESNDGAKSTERIGLGIYWIQSDEVGNV